MSVSYHLDVGFVSFACGNGSTAQLITPPVSMDSTTSWSYSGGNSWSPDGEWIVSSTLGRLQVVNVKTGLTLPLPWSFDYSAPDWKPR